MVIRQPTQSNVVRSLPFENRTTGLRYSDESSIRVAGIQMVPVHALYANWKIFNWTFALIVAKIFVQNGTRLYLSIVSHGTHETKCQFVS